MKTTIRLIFFLFFVFFLNNTVFSEENEPIQLEYNRSNRSIHPINGFSIGFYTGVQNFGGEVYPQEPLDNAIYDMKLLIVGVSFKLKYSLLFLRVGAEGGLTILGGKGNFEAGEAAETYKLTAIHIPASIGFNFPLLDRNSLYLGMGYSYFMGDLAVSSDTVEKSFSYKGSGLHFIIGTDFYLSNSINITFEWVHTTGMSASLGDETLKEREIGFSANQFLLGVNYLFDF